MTTITPAPMLRFSGPLSSLSSADRAALVDRGSTVDPAISVIVQGIIARVRKDGDAALIDLAHELDGVTISALEVPSETIACAASSLDNSVLTAMKRAAHNIEKVHRSLAPQASELVVEPGVTVGRRPDPLQRVGVYVPGGRAAYPSSLLMGVIPARIAGVPEIIVCSPPGVRGLPSDVVLAAASIAGADRVFSIGGAGAIAAMALGTSSVPRVDKIVGPGNSYVSEAKLQLTYRVAIDCPAGPSELLVIADTTASPLVIAREMIAQAEHDPGTTVLAVTIGESLQKEVESQLDALMARTERRSTITSSLRDRGGVVSTSSIEEAVSLANAFAPEHLLIATENPRAILPSIRNAGTVFLGETSSVSFGDYATGANHVLPTGGMARCYSGLSTLDFVRWTTYQEVDRRGAAGLAGDVSRLADAEGLHAHAAAARPWGRNDG